LTSEDTTQDRLNIRDYLDTARKCDVHVMTALRDAVAAPPPDPGVPVPYPTTSADSTCTVSGSVKLTV
jgi:transposase